MLPIGTIFKRDNCYWKITGTIGSRAAGGESYPVIKCTKTGKEFITINGFRSDYLENRGQATGAVEIIGVVSEKVKANIGDGLIVGKKKRRVQYLEAKISSCTKELEQLRTELKGWK